MSETKPAGQGARPMRVQAGLAFVQRLRPALYGLLLASALLSFWAGGEIHGQRMPAWAQAAAPVLFGAFLLIFTIYRLALIRARHYPSATGLFQIGLGFLVFVLLLPGSRSAISARSRAAQSSDDLISLLDSSDARVRAVAAELAGDRGAGPLYAPPLLDRLDDPDAHVRAAARIALCKLLAIVLPPDLSESAAADRLRADVAGHGWISPR